MPLVKKTVRKSKDKLVGKEVFVHAVRIQCAMLS